MDGYNQIATELAEDEESKIIFPADSSLNFVLDVPWSRVQYLLQESDSVLHSTSLNQNRRTSMEDSECETCQNCRLKTREMEEKLADVQQQLSVAVSSNYTKNVMIEQLDKTLSKIVEGWKKLETEKVTQINKLERERNAAIGDLKREQEVLIRVERELTTTLDKLMLSQKEIQDIHTEKQTWQYEYESRISKLTSDLAVAENRNASLVVSNKTLAEDYEAKLRDFNNKFAVNIQQWELQEDKYKSQIKDDHVNLNGLKQEQIQNSQTVKTLQLRLQLLDSQLEDVLREKESLKVEVSILQARNSAAKNEMEEKEKVAVELIKKEHEKNLLNVEKMMNTQFENKINELEGQWQKSLKEKLQRRTDEDARERAILEVEYEKAMQDQTERFNKQILLKEDELECQYRCKDDQIHDLMDQVKQLQQENATLASSRSHLMSRIQGLLENQWQESLRILYGNSETNQPPLKLSLSSIPSLNFISQKNLLSERERLSSCEIPTMDYESVNLQRLHSCKSKVHLLQSPSQPTAIKRNSESPSSLLQNEFRTSFKGLPSKPILAASLSHASKGKNLTLPPTNLFDDFDALTRSKSTSQKYDSSDNFSSDYCLDDDHRVEDKSEKNEMIDAKQGNNNYERMCTSSLASRDSWSCKSDLPPKPVRKTQSLLGRISTPDDELSKMTECSDSLPLSDGTSDQERRCSSKSQKPSIRSGSDGPLKETIHRHEERQLELKKYLEKLLQRPPGEPFETAKDLLPCKDENNFHVNKDYKQLNPNK